MVRIIIFSGFSAFVLQILKYLKKIYNDSYFLILFNIYFINVNKLRIIYLLINITNILLINYFINFILFIS